MRRRPLTLPTPPLGARKFAVVVSVLFACLVVSVPAGRAADPPPAGQMTFAVHFTLAPRWLDPAESEGSITPFLTLYAVHDALLKPMPSGPTASSLAESWSVSADGLVYDFLLRSGVKFHNGETVTADDVKFSFIRGVGPRVEEPALALIPFYPYSAPYEDLRLKP
jgi:ABC-type transport system substrate-binding protein